MTAARTIRLGTRRILAGLAGAGAAIALAAIGAPIALASPPAPVRSLAAPSGRHSGVSKATEVSRGCGGGNAEPEEAAGPPDYVYVAWIGCGGIGFARSSDGGLHFTRPRLLPGAAGFAWDPSVAVAPDGTVYVAFMSQINGFMYPVVTASSDHGASFREVARLRTHAGGNWGDRDFIAAGRHGDVFLTWDYGPSAAAVKLMCSPVGSCSFSAGDVNAVIQKSTDGGGTWGPIIPMGPRFPRNGGISMPLLVQPNGRVDALSWGHYVGKAPGYRLYPGHEFFTFSATGTVWPRHPVEVWRSVGPIALRVWWIDGDLAMDTAGNLYATWDTQTSRGDIGWLSWSGDGGRTWSRPVRVTSGTHDAHHIVEVAGGGAGIAYTAWQTDAPPRGYATYLRPYSARRGWLAPAVRVSSQFGDPSIWPGDTFGIAALHSGSATRLVLSWGSAVGRNPNPEIYAAVVTFPAAH